MRFLLDENETPALLKPLRALYPMHHFEWSVDVFGSGVLDVPLIHSMRRHDYDCLITKDGAQLSNDDERQALFEARIHWVGHHQVRAQGAQMVATLVSSYTIAFPHILEILERADGPRAIHVAHSNRKAKDLVRTYPIDPLKRTS
ncbi:hypothetical protein [Glutamicibacter creatinolyticus]|uniref:PIN-like domain-containing protein n=1 Tax=Glutamicibacter creatinolyticus TaxID=162496 RepID=UPI00321785CD